VSDYLLHLLTLVGIYLVLALPLQLTVGISGLLNLGHLAFFGVGAYTWALLSATSAPLWLSVAAALALSAAFGALFSFVSRRLRGDYFALATLGLLALLQAVLNGWTDLTNGPLGIAGISRPNLLGIDLSGTSAFFSVTAVIAIGTFLFFQHIARSPFGRALGAARDDELAAKALGKDVESMKLAALVASSAAAGLAGMLYASYISFIDPSIVAFDRFVPVLFVVILGGLASMPGTVLATVVVVLLPEPLRFLPLPSALLGPLRQMLYSLALLAVTIARPRGFQSKVDRD